MRNTLVIQSHQSPLPYPWLLYCLDSVRKWCAVNEYEYQFFGDELFDAVPAHILEKTRSQKVVATDLARLFLLQAALREGYETVIWLDADFLIFDPQKFNLPNQPYAVGREVWVQQTEQGKLKVYNKVHNAFLMFRRKNYFLDFYADTSQRLLSLNHGHMPPQFIGPKLLTALHNVAILPVMETAGMLSPMVIKDIIQGDGAALDLFCAHSPSAIAGANLCVSSRDKGVVADSEMQQLIQLLLGKTISFSV